MFFIIILFSNWFLLLKQKCSVTNKKNINLTLLQKKNILKYYYIKHLIIFFFINVYPLFCRHYIIIKSIFFF